MNSKNDKVDLTERQARIFTFIDGCPTGVLASVDPDGEPHAAVIYHCISKKDFSVCFLTKSDTKKYDNLIRNNHIILVVFDPSTQTVAQIIGEAKEVTDYDEINDIASRIFSTNMETKEGSLPPISKLEAGDYAAFKIKPVQIRMANYASTGSGDYSHLFESIESFELKPGH